MKHFVASAPAGAAYVTSACVPPTPDELKEKQDGSELADHMGPSQMLPCSKSSQMSKPETAPHSPELASSPASLVAEPAVPPDAVPPVAPAPAVPPAPPEPPVLVPPVPAEASPSEPTELVLWELHPAIR